METIFKLKWITYCLILNFFSQNFLNGIIDRIFQAGFTNNQASIKYFIEWIIILILHKFPQFLPKFWDCFSYVSKEHFKYFFKLRNDFDSAGGFVSLSFRFSVALMYWHHKLCFARSELIQKTEIPGIHFEYFIVFIWELLYATKWRWKGHLSLRSKGNRCLLYSYLPSSVFDLRNMNDEELIAFLKIKKKGFGRFQT